ncbi:ABC transporter substrate-binding protein [Limobrevibacterium gyesilva]|uniref:ABC transporter substrate-binding protein n=1 Tax=Limobrevibacterium gyesilva TaxID=2991712 RepID=A0AA41YKV7_9PROT|nr:ABC transporter substrate-binding protein [Limobrevibacterium gyesilva]MCW3475239.1 ABC transporter substrate-binding protein [Limobrevibacterium gyesilva]
MRRRDILKSALAGSVALAAPRIGRAEGTRLLKFVPHADLASLDPVWTTADITRNYSLAVFDTLYGIDAKFNVQPQMVAGHTTSSDGKLWELTLRDGLTFHDGTPVLGRDCVATIKRFAVREPLGSVMLGLIDEIGAPSDKVIRIRLKKPFALLPSALSQYQSAIMPERLAKTDPMTQISEAVGSGPFRFKADERIAGAKVVFERNPAYVPRPDGVPSFTAGPKIAYLDRVEWTVMPDAATAQGALMNNEIDWWENPSIDLIPALRKDKRLRIEVKDITGEIGCLRFNHLLPPFDDAAVRRVVLAAMNQRDVMDTVAGAEPSLIKTDVGIFVPGTPYASTVGLEATHQYDDVDKLKRLLAATSYKGEKIVVLAASTIPTIYAEAQVAADVLKRIGFSVDYQALDWATVVQRRASMEPVDKGGWNIFFTYLGGTGNVTPATDISIRGTGKKAWFGWPTSEKMETLRDAWFDAPDLPAQQKITAQMQALFWEWVPYVPLGMYDQPTAYHGYLTDVRDGYPQFYGVRRV